MRGLASCLVISLASVSAVLSDTLFPGQRHHHRLLGGGRGVAQPLTDENLWSDTDTTAKSTEGQQTTYQSLPCHEEGSAGVSNK